MEAQRRGGLEWKGDAVGPWEAGIRLQKLPWTKGWLSKISAVGRRFSCTNTCRRKSLQASVTPSGSMGFVGWVAILKMAAMASYSAHGGFWVSISTTVQATLLRRNHPVEVRVRIRILITNITLHVMKWVVPVFYFSHSMN